jgi:hypothetical protein
MALCHLPALQPYPDGSVQPAGPIQGGEELLAQEQALTTGGDRSKTQFASLITLMQHNPPGVGRALLAIPIQNSDKLFP